MIFGFSYGGKVGKAEFVLKGGLGLGLRLGLGGDYPNPYPNRLFLVFRHSQFPAFRLFRLLVRSVMEHF